jgi:hypothetical protein
MAAMLRLGGMAYFDSLITGLAQERKAVVITRDLKVTKRVQTERYTHHCDIVREATEFSCRRFASGQPAIVCEGHFAGTGSLNGGGGI